MILLIPRTHEVTKGETLFGIARSSGVTIDALRSMNRLTPQSVLKIGDILVIPAPADSLAGKIPTANTQSPAVSHAPKSLAQNDDVAIAPNPPVVRISNKPVDKSVTWPCNGKASYLDGKIKGVMILPQVGELERAIAGGTVVYAGSYRGYGQIAIIQGANGLLYLYGGNERLSVELGQTIRSGQAIGRVGLDPKYGKPIAYFFVFRGNQALDPASAPRGN